MFQITCPGVCLCPIGDIELSIICLKSNFRTLPRPPHFPIILHEAFTVIGFYKNVNCLTQLQRTLCMYMSKNQ